MEKREKTPKSKDGSLNVSNSPSALDNLSGYHEWEEGHGATARA